MRTTIWSAVVFALMVERLACAQGTLVYDQQSVTGGRATAGVQVFGQQPVGQSFMPSLNAIGFVEFQFTDFTGALGASVFVHLRESSIAGSILATSSVVSMPNGFRGNSTFFFPNNVPVTPGATYYLQPALEAGGDTGAMADLYDYQNGTLFAGGVATSTPGLDFWFREGIVVPEPGTLSLVLLGGGLLMFQRRVRRGC